ncbi:serine hydrolase [Paenibacillus montaniterrae]|uniref:Serine hydrolase n=1 Tax=Paenibacillus montaniterrae TaxID=429341 RepID=A0A919YLU7_9BACL|nr:serine hydrolase domain-containing protein [Paenibacillus montaniterrae]GIP15597.1 serine hydrolase [Paenibacillus montaniterrae]
MTITAEPTRISCKEAGYSEDVVQRLEQHFAKLIESDKIQCASYLLSRNGQVFADGAAGQLHYKLPDSQFKQHAIRRIASITKLFTAVAIFQLIEQGKLFLRQPVADWIEEFKHPMFEQISIMHLLTHTSGLAADPFYYLEPYPVGWGQIRFAFEPEEEGEDGAAVPSEQLEKQKQTSWIRALLAGKPLSRPGEEWNYSSSGYTLLGEVIARASGMRYEHYVMEHIVAPLGMKRTFFEVPEELQHEVCIINDYEMKRLERSKLGAYDAPRAGGGLYSTLWDLFRFGQMLLNGGQLDGVRILSRKSVEKMSGNVLDKGIHAFSWGGKIKDKTYGLGPLLIPAGEWLSENTFGHEGAGRCILLLDQGRNAVILFFVPSNTDWCPESMIGTQNIIGAGWL